MNVDQVFVRLLNRETQGATWKMSAYGIDSKMLSTEARDALNFIDSYKELNGRPPSDEILCFEQKWPSKPLAELSEDLAYVSHNIKRRQAGRIVARAIKEAEEMLESGRDDIFEAAEIIKAASDNLRGISKSRQIAVNLFDGYYDTLVERYASYKDGVAGIPGPFAPINEATNGGYKLGEAVCFVARPSIGKTWTLLLHAKELYRQGYNVLLLSPELDREQLKERFSTMQFGHSYVGFVQGNLGHFTEDAFFDKVRAHEQSRARPLWVIEQSMRIEQSMVEDAVEQFDPDIILIDSLYLLGKGYKRSDQIENVSPWVKSLSNLGRKRLAICTSQMNRSATTFEQMGPSNIYGSDAVYQDFDTIYGQWQDPDMYRDRLMGYLQFKVRSGSKSNPTFFTRFDIDAMDFSVIDESSAVIEDAVPADPEKGSITSFEW